MVKTLPLETTNLPLREVLSQLHRALSQLYGNQLAHLILFGSQARGDASSESDIDVLVVLKDLVNPGNEVTRVGKITAELSLQFNTVISCIFLSVQRFETEQSPLLLNIRREGVSF
jgi:uncharacterized protein